MKVLLKVLGKVLFTAVVTVLLYAAIVVLASVIPLGGEPLVHRLLPMQNAGGENYSLTRFREVQTCGQVDIVFAGPSHSYRGADPRLFAAQGYTSQNLGSTSQTPLNSYYVLQRYLDQLRPKMVLYMLYQTALGLDGMESYYDLLSNTSVDESMVGMTGAMRQPQAWTALLATGVRNFRKPMSSYLQHSNPKREELYIQGGFVQTFEQMPAGRLARLRAPQPQWNYTMDSRQLDYMARCIELVRSHNANFVVCSFPIPVESRAHLANYEKTQQKIVSFLAEKGVAYKDFNSDMSLDTARYYYDEVHLNQAGVEIFNAALIEWLRLQNLLPPTSSTSR
jgi:hypothetical protein